MSSPYRPQLPEGWEWSQKPEKNALQAEYMLELADIHPLAGIPVEVVAHREGDDDILVRHCNHEDRVSVVHLTWRKEKEVPDHPTVAFSGSHSGFLEWEYLTYGVSPKS